MRMRLASGHRSNAPRAEGEAIIVARFARENLGRFRRVLGTESESAPRTCETVCAPLERTSRVSGGGASARNEARSFGDTAV